ncbi:MAG: hypothetical protein JJU29_24030 [Verrucomicrobia bacterium]|nr:hypothetical protein [Verrucomicrobiota bacterium]
MKKKQMNHVARSICEYLMSRNNDIAGYWGIGFICKKSISENRRQFHFKVKPGEPIKIYSYELLDSLRVTDKLTKCNLDSIEGRLSYFEDGRYPSGSKKYTCGISVAVTQDGRTGMYICHVACWPHDSRLERRSARFIPPQKPGFLGRFKGMLK